MQKLSRLILRIFGWSIKGNYPGYDKFMAIIAPHTSNLDFVIGRLYFYSVHKKPYFLIKKEVFVFPLKRILLKMGGVPVDRKRSSNVVNKMVNLFNTNSHFVLVITPEGTRSKVKNWKKGFYYIAREANVPVVTSYIDYKKKEIGISDPYFLGDDYQSELKKIKDFVRNVTPKHPEKFSV